jgi:hypothetical protein
MTALAHEISPEEIMAHYDGELPATRLGQVAAHLEVCAECRDLAQSLRATSQSLSAWGIKSVLTIPPQDVKTAKVRYGLSATSPMQNSRRNPRVLWAGALAICGVAVALIGLVAHRPASESQTQLSSNAAHATSNQTSLSYQRSLASELARNPNNEALRERLQQDRVSASLQNEPNSPLAGSAAPAPPPPEAQEDQQSATPLIARTAELQIVVAKFDAARAAIESILARHHGYAASLNVGDAENTARTLNASLRIPSQDLPAALTELKALGHVTSESQAGEEVTAEHADLLARLKNSRETETRLQDILRTRTGKVSDILEVEQEIARVRGEIEQMESGLKSLNHRVDFATITLSISEEYKAKVTDSTPGIATRLHNAAVAGLKNVRDSAVGLALWSAEFLPPLLFWLLILLGPIAIFWRLRRHAIATATASPLA